MKIKDICTSVTDGSHNPPQGIEKSEYMMLSSKNIFDDEITFDEPRFLSEKDFEREHKRTQIAVGDVLLTIVGTVGRTAVVDEDMPAFALQRSVAVLHPKNDVCLPRFLMYALRGKRTYIENRAKGVAQKGIYLKEVSDIDIPIPDISNQEIIINKLDKVKTILKHRQKEVLALDNLIKARFVEMFGDPISNPMKWDIYRLEECLERIDNGKSFICSDKPRTGDNPAILKLSAATYGDYRPNENKALLDESLFVESSEVHAGDLLFTRKNTPELVGTAAYVQNTPPKLMMPDLIFRLVPNEKVNAVFLWQLINCKEFRPVIQAISGGSAKSMSNISKERLGKIKVICPPRELQDSLIPFVEQTDKSKVAVRRALDEAQLLFDSLMQQYFG